jgi:hypothetical protein
MPSIAPILTFLPTVYALTGKDRRSFRSSSPQRIRQRHSSGWKLWYYAEPARHMRGGRMDVKVTGR